MLVVILSCPSAAVQGAGDLDKKTLKNLSQLEIKYFGHSFDPESDDSRVTRLEKLVFGESSSGAPRQRIEKLIAATADSFASSNLNNEDNARGGSEKNGQPATAPAASAISIPSPAHDDVTSEDNGDLDTGSYPHITVLENDILGQTFEGQPLMDRLNRMEIKAFGSPSKSPDLSQRTDALQQYTEKKLHIKPADQEKNEIATTPPQTDSPSPSQSQPQSQSDSQSDSQSQLQSRSKTQQSRLPQQLLSMLGNSLLGMGGMGFGGLGPGMGPGGLGPGGAPMGPGGVGISGLGVHRRNQATQQEQQPLSQQVTAAYDDPAEHAITPPAQNARTLVKVGWCEVQVFGHTFPNMHLPERLSQLNNKLQVKPGASSMQLLDDIGPMIKAVQARQSASAK